MPSARKWALHEVDSHATDASKEPSMLLRIRNMWQFANLFQWIMIFGKAVKIDDNLDIEVRPYLSTPSRTFIMMAPNTQPI